MEQTASPWRPHWMQRRSFWVNVTLSLMALPGVVFIFVFKYLTMAGVLVAFFDYKPRLGIFGSEFVGLKNFQFLFSVDTALRATRNTVLLNLLFIIVGTIVSLIIAALLYEAYKSVFTRFYQTMLLFPYFISWVIASYFVFAFLKTENGLVNNFLGSFNVPPVEWYNGPQYWPIILLVASLWKGMGWGSLIYLAGMLAIDPQYYEAAQLDGATWWQRFRLITIPILAPLIVIQLLLSLGGIFHSDFGLFFQVTRDTPQLYATTDVLDTFIYRALLKTGNIGMSTAANFYQAIVGFVVVLLSNWFVSRIDRDGDKALF